MPLQPLPQSQMHDATNKHLIPDCFSQSHLNSFCHLTTTQYVSKTKVLHMDGWGIGCVKRASELRRNLQSFRKRRWCREGNSEGQTETGTLSPISQAHAGGFTGRTTRPSRPWGSTETVPLCTNAADGDSCWPSLSGKQAINHFEML